MLVIRRTLDSNSGLPVDRQEPKPLRYKDIWFIQRLISVVRERSGKNVYAGSFWERFGVVNFFLWRWLWSPLFLKNNPPKTPKTRKRCFVARVVQVFGQWKLKNLNRAKLCICRIFCIQVGVCKICKKIRLESWKSDDFWPS